MRRGQRSDIWFALLFLAPFLIHLTVFFIFAFARTIGYSFTDKLLLQPSFKIVGLQNYIQLFQEDLFIKALVHSLSFMLVVTALQSFLALSMAAILNQKIRGITFFRTVYYIPSVLSSAAVTLIAVWIFQKTGYLNTFAGWLTANMPIILAFLGLFILAQAVQVGLERLRGLPVYPTDPALATLSLLVAVVGVWLLTATGLIAARATQPPEFTWLTNPDSFVGIPIPLWTIILLNTFTTIPSLMIIFLAGLQDIPKSVYEAAAIDGATPLQQFFTVTVPMLRPVTFLVVTLSLIGTLQMFDQVALMGNSASLESIIVLAYYVYNNALTGQGQVGLASAAAIILAVLTFIIVFVQRAVGISDKAQ